jgi:hypothetical protein
MTPERIFRSAKSARGLVPYNLFRPAISLSSRKLAVCTIAMSVELLRLHFPLGPRPTAVTSILSKDSGSAHAANSTRSTAVPE